MGNRNIPNEKGGEKAGMSRESILKVMEAEAKADRLVEDARALSRKRVEEAAKQAELLCAEVEQRTADEISVTLEKIREKTLVLSEKTLAEAEAEAQEIRDRAALSRRAAEKIIIGGLHRKCR